MRPPRAALALATAACLTLGLPSAAAGENPPLAAAADAAIAAFSGTAGVVMTDPRNGASYEHAADRVFQSASLYKLVVMAEAYRQAVASGLSLDAVTLTITDEDLVDGGDETDSGVTLTVHEAIERMITRSDNSCGRGLVRLLDAHNVNATARSLGMTQTRINTMLPEAERTSDVNETSARDIARLLTALVQGRVVDASSSAEMLGVLGRQELNDRLPSGLAPGTPVAHKTGNLDGIAHDAGVITTPFGPRVVVMLTEGYADYADVVTLAGALAADAFALPLARFAAAISPLQLSAVTRSQPFTATIQVTNASTFAWDGTFRLGVRWRDATGAYVGPEGRADLPPLVPGQTAAVVVQAIAPAIAGTFATLELDVVHEGVAWAETPVRVPVAIR